MSNPHPRSGKWLYRGGLVLHGGLLLIGLALAINLLNPELLLYRQALTPALTACALLGLTTAVRQCRDAPRPRLVFFLAWISVLGISGWQEWNFLTVRRGILATEDQRASHLRELGQHIVVGYEQPEDIAYLVSHGYVGGLYLTLRNSEGKSAAALHAEIGYLQGLRKKAGLPPLMIVSDQEGGAVSRLSPPLSRQPTLSSLITPGTAPHQIEQRAFAYGVNQGRELASLGVNANFSPVVDLKPEHPDESLDFHTLISRRAISSDPQLVSQIGLAYSRGLLSQGILPTLKHFPGLGSADGDTHHFSAHISRPLSTLSAQDWMPFRSILRQTPSMLMISHAILDAVDPENPASVSSRLIRQTIRSAWRHEGILITDDMTMAAVYKRGLCRSSVQALNADVDLLLVSFDWEKVYPVLDCLLGAYEAGQLAGLQTSNNRLAGATWRQARTR